VTAEVTDTTAACSGGVACTLSSCNAESACSSAALTDAVIMAAVASAAAASPTSSVSPSVRVTFTTTCALTVVCMRLPDKLLWVTELVTEHSEKEMQTELAATVLTCVELRVVELGSYWTVMDVVSSNATFTSKSSSPPSAVTVSASTTATSAAVPSGDDVTTATNEVCLTSNGANGGGADGEGGEGGGGVGGGRGNGGDGGAGGPGGGGGHGRYATPASLVKPQNLQFQVTPPALHPSPPWKPTSAASLQVAS